MSLGPAALDGTKRRAAASGHTAMGHDRREPRISEIEVQVTALLPEAEAVDAAEVQTVGADRRGDEVPAEFARRETRLADEPEAQAAVEHNAAEARPDGRAQLSTSRPPWPEPPTTTSVPAAGDTFDLPLADADSDSDDNHVLG